MKNFLSIKLRLKHSLDNLAEFKIESFFII